MVPSAVLNEAYACGTPVIAARMGAFDELVRQGETSLQFTRAMWRTWWRKCSAFRTMPACCFICARRRGRSSRRAIQQTQTMLRSWGSTMPPSRHVGGLGPAGPGERRILPGRASHRRVPRNPSDHLKNQGKFPSRTWAGTMPAKGDSRSLPSAPGCTPTCHSAVTGFCYYLQNPACRSCGSLLSPVPGYAG